MAVATTSGTAPPSQSMDKSPSSPPSPPQTTESSSPTPVTGSPSSAGSLDLLESPSSSPNRNNQLDMKPSLRSEEYRQLFRLPPLEVVIALHLIITTAAILCPVFMILRFKISTPAEVNQLLD